MELVKTTLRLQFTTVTEPWLKIRDMLRVAGGDPQKELHAAPLLLDQQEKRQRVMLADNGIAVELERLGLSDQGTAPTLDLVTDMNKASEFPPVAQVSHTSLFIRPYTLPFHELLSLIKERCLPNNSLVEAATDIGLLFDEQEGETKKSVQMGPMNPGQLQSQYLIWPRENIPDVFLFMALTFARAREEPFTRQSIEELLRSALEWEERQLSLITQTLD